MKIVYDKAKTIERMESDGQLLFTLRKRRNTIWFVNLLLVLTIIAVVAAHFATGSTMSTFTGVGFIVSLTFVIINTINAGKLVPKHPASILSTEAWYHVISEEYTVLEVKAEMDGEQCSVAVVFEGDGEPKTIQLGTYEIRESSEVEEETLDLEQKAVFVPATDVSDAGSVE